MRGYEENHACCVLVRNEVDGLAPDDIEWKCLRVFHRSVFAYFTKDSFTFEDRGFFDAMVKRAHRCIRRGDLVRYLTEQGLVGALPLSAGPAYLMTLK
jgi:hypothetical protein